MARNHLIIPVLIFMVGATVSFAQRSSDRGIQCASSRHFALKALPPDNILARAILDDQIGDGIDGPWTQKMKSLGIKQASAEVRFDYTGDEMKLHLQQVSLFSMYYDDTSLMKNLTSSQKEQSVKALRVPFFLAGVRILRGIAIEPGSCGLMLVNILDDSCFPAVAEIPRLLSTCSEPKLSGSPSATIFY